MIYVFDSSALIDLIRYYYLSRFPTLWRKFDKLVEAERIVSVREAYREIEGGGDRLAEWAKSRKREIFPPSTTEELGFVKEIFVVPHFQSLVTKKARLQGKPVADPFVIARARILEACVITQEVDREHAARIPNVCRHFEVECSTLEVFMERERWTF